MILRGKMGDEMMLGIEEERLKVKGTKCKGSSVKLWLLKFLERFPQAQKNNFRAMCSINR